MGACHSRKSSKGNKFINNTESNDKFNNLNNINANKIKKIYTDSNTKKQLEIKNKLYSLANKNIKKMLKKSASSGCFDICWGTQNMNKLIDNNDMTVDPTICGLRYCECIDFISSSNLVQTPYGDLMTKICSEIENIIDDLKIEIYCVHYYNSDEDFGLEFHAKVIA
jgi:hypothetical protein